MRAMRSPISIALLALSIAHTAPFRVLVDRPGQWEIEWSGSEYAQDTLGDGTVGFRYKGIAGSDVPGDLVAPRLRALVAVPATGSWAVEILTDSGRLLEGRSWSRAKGFDRATARAIEVPARDRDGWSESRYDGFRLVRMDLPLVVPTGTGVKLRERLRLRLAWTGAARLPAGSPWARVVDNPRGVQTATQAARRAAASGSAAFAGNLIDVKIGDGDPFASDEDGVVRLTGSQLYKASGALVGTVSFSNLAVYSGRADTAPAQNGATVEAPALEAIPIERIDRDGDGILGGNDEIRFWGRGANLWKPVEGSALGWRYAINPYAKARNYLVRLDADKGSPDLAPPAKGVGNVLHPTSRHPVWIGRPDKLKEIVIGEATKSDGESGTGWFWRSTETGGVLELPDSGLALPGKVSDTMLAHVVDVQSSWFRDVLSDQGRFGVKGAARGWQLVDTARMIWAGTDHAAASKGFEVASTGSLFAVAGVEFSYRRNLSASDSAVFPAPATGALAIPVPDGKECWVLEDGVAVRKCAIEAGRLLDSASSANTWYAFFPKDPGGIRVGLAARAPATQAHVVKDFLAPNLTATMLVVAPTALTDVAERYAKHREAGFQLRPMRTAIVRTEDIYDLWSGGKMDPSAIRECIRWAHERWGTSHVLLLGGGHFDPRGVTGIYPDVLLPHWEQGPMVTDDFYSFLLPGDATTDKEVQKSLVAVGRIPARNVGEVESWLNKLVVFEDPSKADFGPWRNTVVLAADDVMQVAKPDGIPNHTNQSEVVDQAMSAARPWIRNEKLYLVNYPVNSVYQKPEAARDLQTLLNQGVVGFNYIGHGSATLLADEDLLNTTAVSRTLTNRTRPFLFFAGSCTVGRNDLAQSRGLGELLVVTPDKGAFASFAGTRPTFPDGNSALSTQFWELLSDTSKTITIGEAILGAKDILLHYNTDNGLPGSEFDNRNAYNLLGDPSTVLLPGGLSVDLAPIPDTIAALSVVKVAGRADSSRFFQVRLDVASPLDSAVRPDDNYPFQVFRLSPVQMVSLQSSMRSDSLSTSLQVPARVAFGDSATLRVYTWNSATRRDGGQVLSPRLLLGTVASHNPETQGPKISMRPCDSSWSGGVSFSKIAQIPQNFCIEVVLEDSSGISSEKGPDEGVVFSIPGVKDPWHPDLRQLADYRRASAQLVTDSAMLLPGKTYTFDVLARDLMGNKSQSRLQIEVLAKAEYSLYEVFNTPNPVREGENTAFYFKLASAPDSAGMVDSRIQASIRIHSVSGRLIKVLRTELTQASLPRPRAVWDLRDGFGNSVGNGLYPYSVILRFPDRSGVNVTEIVRRGIVAVSR